MARRVASTAVSSGLWADNDEIAAFAQDLPEEFLMCREMGHRWLPHDAEEFDDGSFMRILRCPRCKTRKVQDISRRGVIERTRYQHPDGYLHEGMGRIAGDGRGVLRLESIRRTITKVEARKR
jgi:hypothetical protein